MQPEVSQLALDLYDELGVAHPQDEALGWPYLILLEGAATAMGRIPTIVRDTDDGPGWLSILDAERAPAWALPWLAQAVGVQLRPGDNEAGHRARIVAHAQFGRGTRDAMIAAARAATFLDEDGDPQPALVGTQHVVLIENYSGSPYRLAAFTLTGETVNAPVVLDGLKSQKPAGMKVEHFVVAGMAWDEATSTWDTAPAVAWDDVDISNPV